MSNRPWTPRTLDEQVDSLAAALGWSRESVLRNIQAVRDYRCWKRIPRCFNGWGVGICARTNHHDGDCSPFPSAKEGV